jgi:hypothetical protein
MANSWAAYEDEDTAHYSAVSPGLGNSPRTLPLTGDGNYVFPSERTKARSMSDNTVKEYLQNKGT